MKKIKFSRKLIYLACAIIIPITAILVFPNNRVQAKEYINKTAQSLAELNKSLRYYEGGLGAFDKSLAASEDAYYEIRNSKSYEDAVPDTKQDIQDIEKTLHFIEQARKQKDHLKVPSELENLDKLVETYYDKIVDALTRLLKAEEFHQRLLIASGDELNREIANLDKLSGRPTDNIEYSAQLSKIIPLAAQAVERFDTMVEIPPDQQKYWQAQRDWHALLFESMKKMVVALGPGSTSTNLLMREIADFSRKSKVITDGRIADTEQWMEKTPIKTLLIEVLDLETKINTEIIVQSEKWNVSSPKMEETPNTSLSHTPSPSPDPSGKGKGDNTISK